MVPLAQEYRGQLLPDEQPRDRDHARPHARGHRRRGLRRATRTRRCCEIAAVITDEIAPRLIGEDALRDRALLGARLPRHLRPAPRPPHRPGRARRASTTRSGTRSAKRSAGPYGSSGAATATRSRSTSSAATTAATSPESATRSPNGANAGFRGCKFKVGGKTPREDAERVTAAREAAGDDFVITIDANQGYTRAQALDLCRRIHDLDIRWFEEPCLWPNDARDMRDVRARRRDPRLRRPERTLPRRLPRPHGDAARSTSATSTPPGQAAHTNWRRMAAAARSTASSSATTKNPKSPPTSSQANPTPPTSNASTPTATRSGGR